MKTTPGIQRKPYRKKLLRLIESEDLIFVLGPRRSGKSTFALELEELLKRLTMSDVYVSRINFEDTNLMRVSVESLRKLFETRYAMGRKNIFLVDEISHLIGWETALNEILRLPKVKVILFSSTREVLSDRIDLVREGRCGVVHMLPLALPEFLFFHGFREIDQTEPVSNVKLYRGPDDKTFTLGEIYRMYISVGGMPVVSREQLAARHAWVAAEGTYCSSVTHDIMEYGSKSDKSRITDPLLLRTVITVLARNVGENISATRVGKIASEYLERPSSTKTVESYMQAILNSHLFFISERFDIRSNAQLKTLSKYYIADTGVCGYVMVTQRLDDGAALENLVYMELLRRDLRVMNGKLGSDEVTFVMDPFGERVYVQTSARLDESNRQKVLSPLRRIKDNYPKAVITMNSKTKKTPDGILIMNALEFLMGAKLR